MHPIDASIETRLSRATQLASIVAKFLAGALLWAVTHLPQQDKLARASCPERVEGFRPKHGIHDIHVDPSTNRHRCATCLEVRQNPGAFREFQCRHESSHNIWRLAGHIFCTRCGAYSSSRLQGLRKTCINHCGSKSAKERRNWMLEGRHPISGEKVGQALPIDLCYLDELSEEPSNDAAPPQRAAQLEPRRARYWSKQPPRTLLPT